MIKPTSVDTMPLTMTQHNAMDNKLDGNKQAIVEQSAAESAEQQPSDEHTIFQFGDDDPVNYGGQIDMMHEIFKQISQQRAYSTRTTVTSQKLIFQPTLKDNI